MIRVMTLRQAKKSEYETLKNATTNLWAARVKQAVQTAKADTKAIAWLTASGINKITNKVTSEYSQTVSIGAAFTVGALVLMAPVTLGSVVLGGAGVTLGSVLAKKITEALHVVTENKKAQLEANANAAVANAEKQEGLYETAKTDHINKRAEKRRAFGELAAATAEEVGRKVKGVGNAIGKKANDIKNEVVKGAQAVRDGVVKGAKAVRDEVVKDAKIVRDGVVKGAQAVRDGAVKGAKAVRDEVVKDAKIVRDGAVKGAQAVRDGAVKGAKAVRDEVVKDAKIVRDGAVKGAQAVRDGVVKGAKAVGSAVSKKANDIKNAIDAAKNRRAQRKAERFEQRSARCTDFLLMTENALGAKWISEHLLTDSDKKFYDEFMATRQEAEQAKAQKAATRAQQLANAAEEKRRSEIQAKLDAIMNSKFGKFYANMTVEDYDAASKKMKATIDRDYERIKEEEFEL